MQEDIENRTVSLAITATRFTGRVFKQAITKYVAHLKNKKAKSKDVIPHGKQTVKQLIGQNQGVTNIEINDKNIRDFNRVARKYGIDYAIKKDRTTEPPKYLVFFKARDADALNAAFHEYTAAVTAEKKPSILKMLRTIHPITRERPKVRNKEKGLEL